MSESKIYMEVNMKLGGMFRQRRELLGLNETELAKKTGVHKSLISKYENDLMKPNFKNFIKLCLALGFNIHDFEDYVS